MKRLVTAAAMIMSLSALAQRTSPLEISLAAGVKENVFNTVKSDIAAFNITTGYDINLIRPNVKNTTSFFTSVKTSKRVSKKFAVSNTIGLDMQQLSIESGFRRRVVAPGVTSFSREYTSQLLPRLKLDFGLNYSLERSARSNFSIGINAGEMLRLSSEGYSYSFVGANINYEMRNVSVFANASLTPYNVTLPNMQNYFGNLNADVVGAYEYRVYDIGVGIAVKLK